MSNWDTSKGRVWVMVADWGAETTVTFLPNEAAAKGAYKEAVLGGADAFYARVLRANTEADRREPGGKQAVRGAAGADKTSSRSNTRKTEDRKP